MRIAQKDKHTPITCALRNLNRGDTFRLPSSDVIRMVIGPPSTASKRNLYRIYTVDLEDGTRKTLDADMRVVEVDVDATWEDAK